MAASRRFEGKAVAITGTQGGIAATIAERFLAAGARVVMGTADDRAAATREDPQLKGAVTFPLDPCDSASIKTFYDRCESALGGLDIVVVPGKSVSTAPVLEISAETFKSVVEEELIGAALLMQEAARRMAPRGFGRIVTLVSMSGKTGVHRGVAPFAAAKGGLITFARVLAAELAASGVTVNTIATSLFEPQVAHMSEARRREQAAGIPVGRFGRPDEAAEAVLFLASDAGGFVTGETLNMSGGRFMD
jgi:NAD(P)-dependent dehydrogenase (short-subunit alcohol dehydrogenase family)